MSVENITNSIKEILEEIDHWLNVNKIEANTHESYHIVFSYGNKILLAPISPGRETTAQIKK